MPPRKRKTTGQATFGPRGQRLWDALAPSCDAARRVLLDEACRLADRLDGLDRVLAGDVDTWLTIRAGRTDEAPSELVINSAMAEARMSATALRQIVTELSPRSDEAAAPPAAGGSESDDLAAKRAKRLADAAAAMRSAQ